jgi:uncharacterized protein (TIGR03437 family)
VLSFELDVFIQLKIQHSKLNTVCSAETSSMTSQQLNRVDHRSLFASWLLDCAWLSLKLGAALLLILLCLTLTARAQSAQPAERNAGQAQSANYRVSTQSVNGGSGVSKSSGFEQVVVISQQAAIGLLRSQGFQMELGVLTSDNLNQRDLTVVSAASYTPLISPGSIASAFGTHLASADAFAATVPLPLSLSGSTITINGRPGELFYIGDDAPLGYGQVNFFVPEDTEEGLAEVVVTAADGTRSVGHVQVRRVAPAFFTTTSDGIGEVTALATSDGINYLPPPFDAEVDGKPNYLVIFCTGIHHNTGLDHVQLTIDGVPTPVIYASVQGQFIGLDQINVIIPPQLRGKGRVNLRLVVDGIEANVVQVRIK